jgi:ribonuclease Z
VNTDIHNPGAPVHLNLSGLHVEGFAISALASYVLVPAFKAIFDLGHCPKAALDVPNAFLTHVHQDHIAGVHRYAVLRKMTGRGPTNVHVPSESLKGLRGLLQTIHDLENDSGDVEKDLGLTLHGVAAGALFQLPGQKLFVDAFDVRHRLPSRGYTISEAKKKLRPEYASRPASELVAAKARGEIIDHTVETPKFTYIGDSTIETLLEHPEVGQSEVLFLEATHLPGTPREQSRAWGHTHAEELAELSRSRPEIFGSRHIVLKHFSMRYDRATIEAVRGLFPEGLRERLVLLV